MNRPGPDGKSLAVYLYLLIIMAMEIRGKTVE
jgi:hypothetical protein